MIITSYISICIEKEKIGTIAGIKSLHEWTWPNQEEDVGFIYARILPGIGEWKKWSPAQLAKIQKKHKHEKPNPQYSTHTESSKKWTLPIVAGKYMFFPFNIFQYKNCILIILSMIH